MFMINPQEYLAVITRLNYAQEHGEEARLLSDESLMMVTLISAMIHGSFSAGITDTEQDLAVMNEVLMVFATAQKSPTKVSVLDSELVDRFMNMFRDLSEKVAQQRYGMGTEELYKRMFGDDNENPGL